MEHPNNKGPIIDIMPIFKIIDSRTIFEYVNKGLLPQPVDTKNGIPLFYENDIKEAFNVDGDLSDLITRKEAEELLKSINLSFDTEYYVRNGLLTKYRITNSRGSHNYYMRSQVIGLEEYSMMDIISKEPSNTVRGLQALSFMKYILNSYDYAIGSREEKEKSILKKYFCEGKSIRHIADLYGITHQRIQQLISYGRKRLPLKVIIDLKQGHEQLKLNEQLKSEINLLKISYNQLAEKVAKSKTAEELIEEHHKSPYAGIFSKSIRDLGLPARAEKAFKACEIFTVGDLVTYPKENFMKIRNFGEKSLNEVKAILKENKLSLGMEIPIIKK